MAFFLFVYQLKNQASVVDQVKADFTLTKASHSEEVARLQQDISILRDDLQLTKQDLDDTTQQSAGHKARADGLQDTLDDEREAHEQLKIEVSKRL